MTYIDPKELSREQLEALAVGKVLVEPVKLEEPVEPVELTNPVEPLVPPVPVETRQIPDDPTKPLPMTATKAWAGGGGAALGAALSEILVLLLPRLAPAEVALNIVLSTLFAFAAAYLSPANRIVR